MANITVGISDWKIGRFDDKVVTYALGSCVGICLYDASRQVGGLSHIMLPDSTNVGSSGAANRMKFADTAIPDMYNKMLTMGCTKITAKITGGALMFAASSERFNIGERNVEAVKKVLSKLRLPIIAQDTGDNFGRTVFFNCLNGEVEVKSTARGLKII